MSVVKQGRILRDTAKGDGLVFIEGKHYFFRLDGMWNSEFAPKTNMLVDADFDDGGKLLGLRAASVQDAAADQTARALQATKATAKKLAQELESEGVPTILERARLIGYPTLGALAAVIVGWFYFPLASMRVGVAGQVSMTLYQALKLLNLQGLQDAMRFANGGGAGIYGLLCIACVLAVLLPWFWHDRRAGFGMMAPLAFMLLAGLLLYSKVTSQMDAVQQSASHLGAQFGAQLGSAGAAAQARWATQFANQFAAQARASLSVGFGAWLSLIGALYLAWRGARKALQLEAPDETPG